jgi:hypothetical protein
MLIRVKIQLAAGPGLWCTILVLTIALVLFHTFPLRRQCSKQKRIGLHRGIPSAHAWS